MTANLDYPVKYFPASDHDKLFPVCEDVLMSKQFRLNKMLPYPEIKNITA